MALNFGVAELLFLFLVVGGTVFWIWMVIEAASREAEGSQDRLVWVIVILLTHLIGALIYFVVRRPIRRRTLGR